MKIGLPFYLILSVAFSCCFFSTIIGLLFLYTAWKAHCGPHCVLSDSQLPVIEGVALQQEQRWFGILTPFGECKECVKCQVLPKNFPFFGQVGRFLAHRDIGVNNNIQLSLTIYALITTTFLNSYGSSYKVYGNLRRMKDFVVVVRVFPALKIFQWLPCEITAR